MGGGGAFWHKLPSTQNLAQLLPLEGASNGRDLGGWRGPSGGALEYAPR